MPEAMYAGKPSSFYASTGGKPVEGAWYGNQRYLGGRLLAPNEHQPGQQVSQEVNQQSAAAQGKSWEEFSKFVAGDLQAPVNMSLPSAAGSNTAASMGGLQGQVDTYRKQLDDTLAKQKAEADARITELRQVEKDTLGKVDTLTTPFREDLENAERERLHVNKNFEENQKLIDELDSLLTQGNELIAQQRDVTGLAAIRNPRIQKTMEDVTARSGVIQAVINARNGQIAQAQTLIDRSIGAITADRQQRISYYDTILELNRQDLLSLDAESKKLAGEQRSLIANDLARSQETVDYVKKLMLNPDSAALMGQAGVSLNDSVEAINQKLRYTQMSNEIRDMANQITSKGGVLVADPKGIPADQLVSFTGPNGQTYHYKMPATGGSGSPKKSDFVQLLKQDAEAGLTLSEIFRIYTGEGGLTADEIYYLYNASSKYGPDDNIKGAGKYGVTQPKGSGSGRTP